MRVGALRHPTDLAAAGREIADDVAHVVGGRHDLHVHDRLEQHGVRLTGCLFDRHGPRDLERHFARVYVVVRPVHQLDYHVHHRIAGEHAVLERFLDALLDRSEETRLNSSHVSISYAVFCLKKKKQTYATRKRPILISRTSPRTPYARPVSLLTSGRP